MKPPVSLAPRLGAIALAASAALLLAACGQKEASASGEATQVAAKVGSSEISVHQINQVLSRTPVNTSSKEAVQAASRAALERLIDQQLAVDQATEQKLHRSPEVVAQLEAARREVLARAYLQQVAGASAKPEPDQVRAYYRENPALFAERRVFNLQEIRVVKLGDNLELLQTMAREGRRIEEVADALRARGIAFGGGSATRTAEQIPLDLLPKLHALKDGQSLVVPAGEGATLIRVASSRQVPVSEEVATPGIVQYLGNLGTTETVRNEIKRLRAATPITYMGEFQQTAAAARAPAAAAAPAAPSVTAEPAKTDDPDASVIERGLQGLK
ncbi:EpsD family peptidyl-prolyl cis-trans isomerase [Hydrogenophaga crocea]|uniref:Peptidyl-prolyl cis-trans isomerase, EpsD family n=1 Tax=Hydrogenophaga crocea TaxID=2716225 RepID=A0A6G8ICB4_9BURK|nr:EpsD family peptidyl-prolyl cis-trans isomerase [Hydrogenophaga crocea]QIM50708.1 peptidyl-prolyl cis-trans isomerase, EpsD family [Hydrogenophaga crocea]